MEVRLALANTDPAAGKHETGDTKSGNRPTRRLQNTMHYAGYCSSPALTARLTELPGASLSGSSDAAIETRASSCHGGRPAVPRAGG